MRSFLTIKRKVNKEIRNTILYRPRMFFSYNNGIGATAEEATVEEGGDGGLRLVRVKDLQIVNGGQTTVSLAHRRRTRRPRRLRDLRADEAHGRAAGQGGAR